MGELSKHFIMFHSFFLVDDGWWEILHRVSPHDQSDQVLKTYGFSPVSEDFLNSAGPSPPDPDRLDAWHHPNGRHRQLRHGAIREARDHGGGVADGGDTSPGDQQIPGQTMAKAMALSVKISGFQMGLWMFNDVYLHIWVYNVCVYIYIYIWVYICVTWA